MKTARASGSWRKQDRQSPVDIDLLTIDARAIGQHLDTIGYGGAQRLRVDRIDFLGWPHGFDRAEIYAVQLHRPHTLAGQRRQFAQVLGAPLGDRIRKAATAEPSKPRVTLLTST